MDKAFTKGLRLLETLALSDQPRGVSDLAAEMDFTKSNVHRILTTLQAQGYVRQVPPNSAYELTTKIWELGSHVIRRMDLSKVARPAMLHLAESTGETVHLSILADTDVVYIDKIEGAHHIRAYTSVGARAPAFAMATGKAMLAHMPEKYLDRFVPLFQKYTAHTRATLEELKADLDMVRAEGFAIVPHGEWRDGIAACACAILDRNGEVVGAIGMSGPDSRLSVDDLKRFSPHVMQAAHAISTALGYAPRA